MTTQYTPTLKLALPVTGELSGTWGDVVNDNITSMVEQAIAGLATINTWTANAHTLTTANGTTSESRCAMLVLTDTGTALSGAATVVCPTASKIYIVKNTSGQSATIKTAAGTGVAIPNGETMFVFCDGTNVVQAVTRIASADVDFAKLKGTGAVVVTNILDEDNMASDSATALATQQSIKAYVDAQVGSFDTLAEVLAQGNTTGGTDLAVSAGDDITFTATSNAIFADNGKAIFGAGSDLQIYHDGTTSKIDGNLSVTNALTLFAGTANGVTYLNGSKVLTSGSALTFDGSNLSTTGQVLLENNKYIGFKNTTGTYAASIFNDTSNYLNLYNSGNTGTIFYVNAAQQMRLTSTGLGIGTSSPSVKLEIKAGNGDQLVLDNAGETYTQMGFKTNGIARGTIWATATDFSLYTYSTQPIVFYTNTAERARIDSSGNLGLGVTPSAWSTSAQTALQVYTAGISGNGGGNTASRFTHGCYLDGSTWKYQYTGVGPARYEITGPNSGSTHSWSIAAGGTAGNAISFTQAMTLTADGEFLVGKTSSSTTTVGAEINSDGGIRSTKSSTNTNLATNNGGSLMLTNSSATDGNFSNIGGYNSNGLVVAQINLINSSHASRTGALAFMTHNGSDLPERMRIDSAGNVGIGTSSPGVKLHVNSGATAEVLRIEATTNPLFSMFNAGAREFYIQTQSVIDVWGQANKDMRFGTNDAERVRITSAGSVGIGTSSPSANLDIVTPTGTAKIKLGNNTLGGGSYLNLQGAPASKHWFVAGNYNIGGALEFIQSTANGGSTPAGTASMLLDSAGNLGLGVTPSAWDTLTAFQIKNGSVYGYSTGDVSIGVNNYYGTSNFRYITSSVAAGKYTISGNEHYWYQAPSGTAGDAISFTQAMTLTAAGNLGIGTSSPAAKLDIIGPSAASSPYLSKAIQFAPSNFPTRTWSLNYDDTGSSGNGFNISAASTKILYLNGNGNVGIGTTSPNATLEALSSTAGAEISRFEGNYSASGTVNLTNWRRSGGAVASVMRYNDANTDMEFGTTTSHPQAFITGGTERARIDSSGNLLVNTTSATGSARFVVEQNTTTANPMAVSNPRSTASTDYSILFYRNASIVGSIQTTLSSTAYVTSSDYRLKENIAPMTGALDKVAQLKPCTYNWKLDGEASQGFIAHELAEVVPECVTGEKDAVDAEGNPQYQGIDTSFLVATLTAAIQEQQAIIESLTARVSALEGN
jgi:hypothetical protein